MEIKLLAAPLDMPEAIDYMEEELDKMDPLFICVNLNQLLKDGFSERKILALVASLSKSDLNTLHLMQPKDNEFYYTDEWIQSLYRAWDTFGRILWWQPSKIPKSTAESQQFG